MHPAVLVLVPVAALIVAPRVWVMQVLKRHNQQEQEGFRSGAEMAEELLEYHQLKTVKVEWTDIGDHYDPATKTIRLTRDKYERKTLTAVTTAAHEVAHAFQDASSYGPFLWRMRLMKLAQATGLGGSVILIAAPATTILTRHRISPLFAGVAALAILGTGLAAQLAALFTELDASFRRTLPLLRDKYLDARQAKDAKKILLASSFTYVASSLFAVVNIWPWLGRSGPAPLTLQPPSGLNLPRKTYRDNEGDDEQIHPRDEFEKRRMRRHDKADVLPVLVRSISKPLIRSWFRLHQKL